jgi:hypothetical protein
MSQITQYSYLGQPEVVLQHLKPGPSRERFSFERVIFLDFDGVLHEQGADDADEFCFADNFRDVLVEVDLAGVVQIWSVPLGDITTRCLSGPGFSPMT